VTVESNSHNLNQKSNGRRRTKARVVHVTLGCGSGSGGNHVGTEGSIGNGATALPVVISAEQGHLNGMYLK
jgi:hypothetical protein